MEVRQNVLGCEMLGCQLDMCWRGVKIRMYLCAGVLKGQTEDAVLCLLHAGDVVYNTKHTSAGGKG